jgi:hypothetical protein
MNYFPKINRWRLPEALFKQSLAEIAYSDGCRTLIPISVGQHSDFNRTPFRFISDSVPG